ncbi:carbohydrate-binding module family 14 protein [Kitasatospora sp. NPDC051984]|uniref:carbohydrate-binding module family 14 protein n=1 Tax=Kitasatospora sp. NPDC051984 TaxID=3364059 RepID=UPI0037C550FD
MPPPPVVFRMREVFIHAGRSAGRPPNRPARPRSRRAPPCARSANSPYPPPCCCPLRPASSSPRRARPRRRLPNPWSARPLPGSPSCCRNPDDRSFFYACDWGTPILMHCPDGLEYDPVLEV